MLYTTYYAESTNITKERYQDMKTALKKTETFMLRKLEFIGAAAMQPLARYYLCVKNGENTELFLEKKYIQNGLYYKKCTKLTREECEKITAGDLEWMKNHKKELLADFYRQATLNNLHPGRITDYTREIYRCKKGEYLIFNTAILRGVGMCKDLFAEPEMKISCLEEEKILVIYKKKANLPQIVSSMLQGQDETAEESEFAF